MNKQSTISMLLDHLELNQNRTIAEISKEINCKYKTVNQTIKRYESMFYRCDRPDTKSIAYSVNKRGNKIQHHYIHEAFFGKELKGFL